MFFSTKLLQDLWQRRAECPRNRTEGDLCGIVSEKDNGDENRYKFFFLFSLVYFLLMLFMQCFGKMEVALVASRLDRLFVLYVT